MTIDEMISNLETATMLFSNVVIDRDGVSQLKSWLTELKELRALNQPQIDELVHGQEVEVPKLTDEEVNELLSTVNPNEVTKDCEDCKARIKAETLKGFKDLGKLYSEIRADAIDEILSKTKTIVDEDGIIFEAVLVKDIEKKMQDCTMKRTLENCSLIRKMESQPNQYDGKCEGFAGDTDEPCEMCKECKLNVWYED